MNQLQHKIHRHPAGKRPNTGAAAKLTAIVLIVLPLIAAFSCRESPPPGEGSKTASENVIKLGKWDERSLEGVMSSASLIPVQGERITFISARFLGTKYEPDTLIGSKEVKEALVVNLEGMDCFTYLDYVEAMRLSGSAREFVDTLKTVRYDGGNVEYSSRKHFFTQWSSESSDNIRDVTTHVGGARAISAVKELNLKGDGTLYLPGIPLRRQEVSYIPAADIDSAVIAKLKTGDYIGVYTDKEGLDVSHTGIFVRKEGGTYFRHASSKRSLMKVADEDFKTYFADKPGIVVFRPK